MPGKELRAKLRASRKAKSDFSLVADVFDMRGAADDPSKAVITCAPNMKQGNQLIK